GSAETPNSSMAPGTATSEGSIECDAAGRFALELHPTTATATRSDPANLWTRPPGLLAIIALPRQKRKSMRHPAFPQDRRTGRVMFTETRRRAGPRTALPGRWTTVRTAAMLRVFSEMTYRHRSICRP